jgi:hypothetical protein
MWVVFTKHVTNNAGTFPIGAIWGKPQFMHRKQYSALDGFQPITHIRERSANDHAHRVFEI